MKLRLAAFFTSLLVCQALPAQEPASAAVPVTAAADAADAAAAPLPAQTARTFIPHLLEVKPFTPPPPPVVKRLPAVRVDAAVTHRSKNGRTLTLQRGEPSTEPDLPPPPPPPPYVAPHEPTPEEIARRLWYQRHNLNLGATVYDHQVSVVTWTDPGSRVHYQAVCGFDIGLLGGVGRFTHRGEGYSLMLFYSHFNTTSWRRLAGQLRVNVPQVPVGEIHITRGDAEDETALAPIIAIRDVIAAEQHRLLPYQAARAVYFKASAAWHAAHPPVPRDETIILRPHRGSRYVPKQ